jgi:hypothetical protein
MPSAPPSLHATKLKSLTLSDPIATDNGMVIRLAADGKPRLAASAMRDGGRIDQPFSRL